MGRKRTRSEVRIKGVSARLTETTYDRMSHDAQRLGLSRAAYVEHLIENMAVTVIGGSADAIPVVVINELKRVGNNLNQIAHARNAGDRVDAQHFRSVLAQIIEAMCRSEVLKRRYDAARAEVGSDERPEIADAHLALSPPATPPLDANKVPDWSFTERQALKEIDQHAEALAREIDENRRKLERLADKPAEHLAALNAMDPHQRALSEAIAGLLTEAAQRRGQVVEQATRHLAEVQRQEGGGGEPTPKRRWWFWS